ncbi:MAG: glycosyltransferase, partial [Oscillochloris sp.]|nr:glycosyltransferase [Oscillochloris sp.]
MPTSDLILHVIDHLGAGGAQRLLADLTLRLHQRGRRVAVITMRHETDLSRSIARAGVPVTALGLARIDPRQLSALFWAYRSMRPAIVHTHLMGANTIGRVAAALAGVPAMVVHDHDSSAEIYT